MNQVLKILKNIGLIVRNAFLEIGLHPLSQGDEEVMSIKLKSLQKEVERILSLIEKE